MARIGLRKRLAKIEKHRNKSPGAIHCLEYEVDATGTPASLKMVAWLNSPNHNLENLPAAIFEPYRNILNWRVILTPRFGTDEVWENASVKQQRDLLNVSRSRTPPPPFKKAELIE